MGHILRVVALLLLTTASALGQEQPRGPWLDLSEARSALRKMVPDTTAHDILLLTLDATQFERFAAFGGTNPEPLPHLDKLAAKSTIFTRAWSVTPHRLTSLVSIHHSLYPSTIAGVGDTTTTDSLASVLGDSGYNPWGIFRSDIIRRTNEPVGRIPSTFDFPKNRLSSTGQAKRMLETMGTRINARRPGERFLGWVHLHFPYPPARRHPGINLGNSREDHYRAALRYTDKTIGDFLQTIEAGGASERTIVVIAGLHGVDQIPNSGSTIDQKELNDRTLRVPLLIHIPKLRPAVVTSDVELVDIAPTLVDLSGAEMPWSFQGRSLLKHLVEGSQYKDNRAVFATHLRFADDPTRSTVQRMRQGDWTLHFGPMVKPSVLRRDGADENLVESRREKAVEMGYQLESFQIMNEYCTALWKKGERRPADLFGGDGDIARARYYTTRRKKIAIMTARKIVKDNSRHLPEALEILLLMDAAEKPEDMVSLLSHPSGRVRSLAGALLLGTSASDSALDHVAAGFQGQLPATTSRAILTSLISKKPAGAMETIASFEPSGEKKEELVALRDLALAGYGDEAAINRLPHYLLQPGATYNLAPFFTALKKLRPERFAGLCKIILTHGDGSEFLTRAALEYLFENDVRDAAYAVAQAIRPDATLTVITQAILLLNHWQSHEGVSACLKLGQSDLRNTDLAARVLFKTPAILDSPLIPSRRFDHFTAERRDGQMDQIAEAADIVSAPLEFSVRAGSESFSHFALLFRAEGVDASLNTSDLRIVLDTNGSKDLLRKGTLTFSDGLYCWTGVMPAGRIEPGTNTFSVSLTHAARLKLRGHAVGFVLFPDGDQKDFPVAGIDTIPADGRPPVTRAVGHINTSARTHALWLRRDGPGTPYGELRVMADGKTFMRIATADLKTPRVFAVKLPDRVNRDTKIELLCVDVPKTISLTGLLIERR